MLVKNVTKSFFLQKFPLYSAIRIRRFSTDLIHTSRIISNHNVANTPLTYNNNSSNGKNKCDYNFHGIYNTHYNDDYCHVCGMEFSTNNLLFKHLNSRKHIRNMIEHYRNDEKNNQNCQQYFENNICRIIKMIKDDPLKQINETNYNNIEFQSSKPLVIDISKLNEKIDINNNVKKKSEVDITKINIFGNFGTHFTSTKCIVCNTKFKKKKRNNKMIKHLKTFGHIQNIIGQHAGYIVPKKQFKRVLTKYLKMIDLNDLVITKNIKITNGDDIESFLKHFNIPIKQIPIKKTSIITHTDIKDFIVKQDSQPNVTILWCDASCQKYSNSLIHPKLNVFNNCNTFLTNNSTKISGCAFLVTKGGMTIAHQARIVDSQTSNQSEMITIKDGLRWIKNALVSQSDNHDFGNKLIVFCDNMSVINTIRDCTNLAAGNDTTEKNVVLSEILSLHKDIKEVYIANKTDFVIEFEWIPKKTKIDKHVFVDRLADQICK